jgi:hypothetical protein
MLRTSVLCLLSMSVLGEVNWLSNHKKSVQYPDGWGILGSYCFAYTPGASTVVGTINLRLEPDNVTADKPTDYQIMLLDDEHNSMQAFNDLKKTCSGRKKIAKNYADMDASFTVQFPTKDDGSSSRDDKSFTWIMSEMQVKESTTPRTWSVAIIRCNKTTEKYKPIEKINYDLRFGDLAGYYNKDTGPTQCYSTHTWDGMRQDGLIAGIVVFVLLDCIMLALIYRQYKKCKTIGGHTTIGQHDDDAENNLNLDDVNMLQSNTRRSDDM